MLIAKEKTYKEVEEAWLTHSIHFNTVKKLRLAAIETQNTKELESF